MANINRKIHITLYSKKGKNVCQHSTLPTPTRCIEYTRINIRKGESEKMNGVSDPPFEKIVYKD